MNKLLIYILGLDFILTLVNPVLVQAESQDESRYLKAIEYTVNDDCSAALDVFNDMLKEGSEIDRNALIQSKSIVKDCRDGIIENSLASFFLQSMSDTIIGHREAALKKADKVVQLAPNYGPAYLHLAMIYREYAELGNRDHYLESAVWAFKKALDLSPNITTTELLARIGLSTVYAKQEKWEEAQTWSGRAVSLAIGGFSKNEDRYEFMQIAEQNFEDVLALKAKKKRQDMYAVDKPQKIDVTIDTVSSDKPGTLFFAFLAIVGALLTVFVFFKQFMSRERDAKLIDSIILGNKDDVVSAIDNGANVDQFRNGNEESGTTPLMMATIVGSESIVELLLSRNADPNLTSAYFPTPIGLAAAGREFAQGIREEFNIDFKCGQDNDYLNILSLLITSKADPNKFTKMYGVSPLAGACGIGNYEAVKLLLKAGANPSKQKQFEKCTPLINASSMGHIDIAKILIEYGAKLNERVREENESAASAAIRGGHYALLKYLYRMGENVASVTSNDEILRYLEGGYLEDESNENISIDHTVSEDILDLTHQADDKIKRGKIEQAINLLTQAIELNKYYLSAYKQRGYCYQLKEQYGYAIGDYKKYLDILPDSKTHYNLGLVYLERESYKEAVGEFTSAINLNPEYTAAFSSRGYAYIQLGNIRRAKIDCERACELGDCDNYNSMLENGLI